MENKKYDINKIRAVQILDVAKKLGVEFKKTGTRYKAICPWHNESDASLVVFKKEANDCYCFGCQKHGDVLSLIEQVLGKDFVGACEWLESVGYDILDVNDNTNPDVDHVSYTRRMEGLMAKPWVASSRDFAEGTMLFSMSDIERSMTMDNSFVRCLKEVFGTERTIDVMRTYRLCSFQSRYGGFPNVGFPLIDIKGRVRDFKIQAYECDCRSDRFFHCDRKVCYWYGPTQAHEGVFDHNCLFGEHLLDLYPKKIVILVESSKNACVGYAESPQYIWLATGNKGMLKREVLAVLNKRKVVAFPDNDAYDEWYSILQTMPEIQFDCMLTPGNMGAKGDIADWIISTKTRRL